MCPPDRGWLPAGLGYGNPRCAEILRQGQFGEQTRIYCGIRTVLGWEPFVRASKWPRGEIEKSSNAPMLRTREPIVTSSRVCLPPSSLTNESSQYVCGAFLLLDGIGVFPGCKLHIRVRVERDGEASRGRTGERR